MTVPIRPAATVMVLRDREPGALEVLLLRRSTGTEFVPGAHVFPGGAVDPRDSAPELIDRTSGLDAERASRRLGVDEGGLAYWLAAVRETFEEAGLLLGATAAGEDPWADPGRAARLRRAREALDGGRLTLAELAVAEDLCLDLSALRPFGRWITPPGAPRRYDTRFFVAPAPPEATVEPDEREAVAAEWVRPAEALDRFGRGEIELILPTERSLAALADHRSSADVLAWLDSEPAEVDDHGGWRAAPPADDVFGFPERTVLPR